MPAPGGTIGIEEEYILVDRGTRNAVTDPPPEFMTACREALGDHVHNEFLLSQIEVDTPVCTSIAQARAELARLRGTIGRIATGFGMAPIAASTHPFARWAEQRHTPGPRYDLIARDLGGVVRRLLICGQHVHVGTNDPELRIDLMNQVSYFLPHLLALTGSSPFWQGEDMGVKSYRLSVFHSLPRTGLPDRMETFAAYQRMVQLMLKAGLVEDETKIWWDVRPSSRYPTLELRVCDMCTTLEDSLCLAALYACLLSMLWRLRELNQRWRIYPNSLIAENRWLAQRYGVDGELVDFGKGERRPLAQLVEELIELVEPDARRLDCLAEVAHARTILRRGTSADRQRKVHADALAGGADRQEALLAVVDWLIDETATGTEKAEPARQSL
ncbi:MAG: carboxylate-amine ligase [Sneathiellaceae bacterium]